MTIDPGPRVMVAISAREWNGLESRPHHFMRLFAGAGWEVLFVEPPASLIAPLKRRSMAARWKQWRQGPRPVERGVTALAPPPILPFANMRRRINAVNQRLIGRSINHTLASLPSRSVDVYSFLPGSIDLLPHLRYERLIYDCVDDHAAFTGLIDGNTVRRMEQELMQRSDLCVASASSLLERARRWNTNAHLVPNGCEYEHFARTNGDGPSSVEPKPLTRARDDRRAVVGFVGGLGTWIDIDLIADVARRMPALDFVLVGPATVDTAALDRLANVHLPGLQPYRELPGLLRRFAVCLIPFRVNELTRSVNPIKLFEYLAAGKPVVSTPLPEVLPYDQIISIAGDVNAFVAAIENALAPQARGEEAIRARQAIAAQSSWTARWERVAELMRSIEPRR